MEPWIADAEPTAYGCCAGGIDSGGAFIAAVPGLVAMVPGARYAAVSPFRSFDRQTHWVDWLAGLGLKERRELPPA